MPAKPSLDLLRSLTDEHVLRALLTQPRLTRAELAARTGISKPTVSESVRRLTELGLLRDTGERTTGRGRIGSYYALADDLGTALVASIAPAGIVAEAIDVHGRVTGRSKRRVPRSARPAQVASALRIVAAQALGDRPARLAVVSAADPVDRATGRLVHLPDAPFLVGELSPADVLAPLVDGPVRVDNDVNWAARAERAAAGPGELDDFAYLYLGEGLGCAVVADGEVRRGRHGLAGEIAHLVTTGPRGRATPLIEVFGLLGLRHPGSTAIDTAAVLAADRRTTTSLASAVSGVLAAVVALTDPREIVLGGRWGTHPPVLAAVRAAFAQHPRPVPLRPAAVTGEAPLSGARRRATDDLQESLLTRSVKREGQSRSAP